MKQSRNNVNELCKVENENRKEVEKNFIRKLAQKFEKYASSYGTKARKKEA